VSRNTERRIHPGLAPAWLLACVFCAAAALLFFRCASLDAIAGTGSQAGNGRITCIIYNSDGSPASNALVLLRRNDFLADTAGAALAKQGIPGRDTRTDEAGAFCIDSVDTGTYCIEVNNEKTHAVLLSCTVTERDTFVRIPDDTLYPTGSIKGAFASTPVNAAALYIQVYGLERVGVWHASIGQFVIKDVPRGSYTLRILASPADYRPLEINNVAVVSDQETNVGKIDFLPLSQWQYSRRIYLNTSTTGAAVSGTVTNFPVLVRLQTGNFDFSRAKADGSDLRFAKADATPLSFEIERWDASAQAAEVWVKVDTMYGNDSTQSFIMYWGNDNASDESNGAAVFDTASGFAGVWHLAQPVGAIVPDATANNCFGTATATTTVTGAVGMAQAFNGTSSLIRASGSAVDKLNFPENGTFSVSAWVKTNVLDSLFHGIVYKSNEQYGLQMRPKNRWEFVTFIDKARWEMSRAPAADTSWHVLSGVRNGSRQYFYVDGVCMDSSVAVVQTNLARVYDQPLEIGHCPDGGDDPDRYFNGLIDEVRVSKTAYGADWMKLCYMNQKERDALVLFR
jgi:hypothetical protein